jgi:hypothetical protein
MDMKPNDEELDAMIRDAARDLHDPPTPPRDAMWAEIDRRRRHRRGRPAMLATLRPHVWAPLAAAAAVLVLVIGFTAGRLSTRAPETTGTPAVAETVDPAPSPGETPSRSGDSVARQVAARDFLSRTETLLVQFAAARNGESDDEMIQTWARQLLTENRLLMDADLGDEKLARLLYDLEFVLAQIVMLGESRDGEETDWIREDVDRSSLLLRVQSQSGTPVPGI